MNRGWIDGGITAELILRTDGRISQAISLFGFSRWDFYFLVLGLLGHWAFLL
jgi:hypothetical protein